MLPGLTKYQLRYPKTILLLCILVLAFFTYQALSVEINPNFDTLISQSGEYNTNERRLQNAFQPNQGLSILIALNRDSILQQRPKTVKTPRFQQYYTKLRNVLNQSQYVLNVGQPKYTNDGKNARITAQLQVPESNDGIKQVKQELTALMNTTPPPSGAEATLAGFPLLIDRVPTLLIQDNLRTVSITFLLIIAVLFYYFRKPRTAFVAAFAPLASLILLGGAMGLLNIDITITLAAVAVLILGLGADYTIHILIHYAQERDKGSTAKEAMRHALSDLRIAVTASFMTTLAGFAALILGVSPSSQAQGIVLSIGIIAVYCVSIILTPVLILVVSKDTHSHQNFIFKGVTEALKRLAVYQSRNPYKVLSVILIITLIMSAGMTQVRFSTSNSNWIPDDDPISEAFRKITWNYGETQTLSIVLSSLQGDLRSVQTARDVQRLTSKLRNIPNVDSVTSPYDNVSLQTSAIQHLNPAAFSKGYTLTRIQIHSMNFNQDENGQSRVLQEVRSLTKRHPVYHAEMSLFGDIVRFDELGKSLQRDTGVTTMIGLALVFLIVSVTYWSFIVGITSLLPILIAVIWAVGLMGYLNVPFTSLSTGIVSLVLGIGADFSIHLVDGIRRFLNKGNNLAVSIQKTLDSAGNAILLASVTTLFGFVALTTAVLLGTQRLGLSLAFSIISVFFVAISFVPAAMSIYLKV